MPTDALTCTAVGSVNNGSFDPDGDPITLSQLPPGPYALGTTDVTLSVSDIKGASASCPAKVMVIDKTPPVISALSATPNVLWPPNHKMIPVSLSVAASDNCDSAPRCQIITVNSNEPINGLGDGDTAPDWEITGNLAVNLRAERSGNGSGRIYTITVECSDVSGNSMAKDVTVSIPHDKSR